MTSAPHAFRKAVGEKKVVERPTVTFVLESTSDTEVDKDGEPIVVRSDIFHATQPTNERLFIVAATAGDEDSGAAQEAAMTFSLLKSVLPLNEYKIIRERLLDPEDDVDLSMLQQVLTWLMEQWTSFPTQQPSDSSTSPDSTGAPSTGRVRGPGSTH
jgi:hypothetical protein